MAYLAGVFLSVLGLAVTMVLGFAALAAAVKLAVYVVGSWEPSF